MEELKTSTRVLLVSAVLLLVILLTGPLGYKFSIVPLEPSLISILVAVVGGALVVVTGLVLLVIALRAGQARNRNLVALAMVLGLIPLGVIGPQMASAGDVPQIHDISTDTENPPAFVALKTVRENAPNGLEYGASEAWPAEKLAATTQQAYPNVKSMMTELSVEEAVARAQATLSSMGLEIVDADPTTGRVEATATTFWFGFKDDVVVRVASQTDGTKIDVRSMSRVGQSDLGVNAARILTFFERF